MLIAAVECGDQVFAPVLAPGDGAAQLSRQPNQKNVFGRQRHLLAETAADVGRHDAQIGFRKLQAIGDRRAGQVRHLRGAGQRHAARRRVERRVRGARFKRRRVLAVGADLDADDLVRPRDGRVEIRGLETAFDHDIGRAIVMHARRAGLQRLLRVDDRRQVGNLDLHRFGDVFGLRGR